MNTTKTTEQELIPDGYITTLTRRKLSLENPQASQIDIADIAVGLANKAHFNGQMERYFSIAEHSMMVCNWTPHNLKLVALLHDASEAYLGDISKPLKVLLPDFQIIENRLQRVIFERFGLDYDDIKLIKPMDKVVQVIEYNYFFKNEGWIECLPPLHARDQFLTYFHQLKH